MKSAWKAWKSFPDVTEAFKFLENRPYFQLDTDDSIFKLLEGFTIVLYNKSSNVLNVNEARKEIITKEEQNPGEHTFYTGKLNSRHFVRTEIRTVHQLLF